MKKTIVSVLVILLLVFSWVGISVASGEKVFKTLGGWDMPPAYNGNPFAPGGVGAATDYIYGKLAIYRPLTADFVPYLAESFEEKDNTLVVKLKEGLYWDDGVPFTSKDVKANYIICGGIWTWSHIWDSLDSIETPDDNTVVFKYNENRSILVTNYILTEWQRVAEHIFTKWMGPAEELINLKKQYKEQKSEELKKAIDEKNKEFQDDLRSFRPEKPIGIGPFRLTRVTADAMELEKVEEYPGIENLEFDKISMGKFTKNELAWAQFMAGEVDMEKPSTPRDVVDSILKAQPKIKHIPVPDFASFCVVINQEKYPFSDARFRQALAYIIDRDKVRELALYYGTTTEYICGVLPSVIDKWVNTKILNPYNLDYNRATLFLKEAGLKKNADGFWCNDKGEKIELEVTAREGYTDWVIAAEEIARELTDFGIVSNVRIVQGEIFGETLASGKYDMSIEFSVFAKRHPLEGFKRLYIPGEWIEKCSKLDKVVKGPNGEDMNLTDLTIKLSKTFDVEEQKAIIVKLAWATNKYLPVIEFLEKNSQFFICDGVRITGWPYGDELRGGLAADWRLYVVKWMLDGTLKAVVK